MKPSKAHLVPIAAAAVLATAVLSGSCKGGHEPGAAPVPGKASPQAAAEVASAAAADEVQAAPAWEPLAIGLPEPRVAPQKGVPGLYQKASKAFKAGDGAAAREALDRVLAKDPLFDQALWLGAQQHVKDGEAPQALALLERLVALDCRKYDPAIARAGWLEGPRSDASSWKPFEEKIAAYRKLWAEALAGPGVFFVQSRWADLSQPGADGLDVDLTWARGSLIFWSRKAGRFLPIAMSGDVAGFLHDRERDVIYLVHWQPHPDGRPGVMGKTSVSRIDLAGSGPGAKPIRIADESGEVRAAIDADGNLIFEVDDTTGESVGDDPASLAADKEEAEAMAEEEAMAAAEEAGEAEGAEEAATGGEGDEGMEEGEAEAGAMVEMAHFADGKIVDGVLPPDMDWQLTVTLGTVAGPAPAGDPSVQIDPPKAKRGGACVWVEAGAAVCLVPTKIGGRFHDVELREDGAATVKLAPEWIPLVQY